MIVPEYWSEAKEQIQVNGRKRTLKRFGWSDTSESDAHENAKERVRDAARRALAGESVRTTDYKVVYGGAVGLPIREEIVERHGESIITRNSYGALCLNTPDVLFADIDVPQPSHGWLAGVLFFAILAVGFWGRFEVSAWWPLVVAFVAAAVLSGSLARIITDAFSRFQQDPFETALATIESFTNENPSWLLRVYRTPMGYRVLVMHATFDPTKEESAAFMRAVSSDPIYARLCRSQKCFRARLSPKPWRIGVEHIRPRPGVWPIKAEHMDRRRQWVKEYEQKSAEFAACNYVTSFGNGRTSTDCDRVRVIHDRFCRPESNLPIA
jgi:hypothetical protein